MPQFLSESVVALKNGAQSFKQENNGRTYFRMHPKLEERIFKLKSK